MSFPRVLSLLIAIGYLIWALTRFGIVSKMSLGIGLTLLIPLALIWFPKHIGQASNYRINRQTVDKPSPPMLVAVAGWFFLVVLPLLFFWLSRLV